MHFGGEVEIVEDRAPLRDSLYVSVKGDQIDFYNSVINDTYSMLVFVNYLSHQGFVQCNDSCQENC